MMMTTTMTLTSAHQPEVRILLVLLPALGGAPAVLAVTSAAAVTWQGQ
jgi:hypothetical protein